VASTKVPPHARAGLDGRGHRFAADPQCSADMKRVPREDGVAKAPDGMRGLFAGVM
jgi:hypothetical protein